MGLKMKDKMKNWNLIKLCNPKHKKKNHTVEWSP